MTWKVAPASPEIVSPRPGDKMWRVSNDETGQVFNVTDFALVGFIKQLNGTTVIPTDQAKSFCCGIGLPWFPPADCA